MFEMSGIYKYADIRIKRLVQCFHAMLSNNLNRKRSHNSQRLIIYYIKYTYYFVVSFGIVYFNCI